MDIDKNILLGDLLNGNSFEDAAHKPTDKASFIDWSSSWAMYVVFSLDFFYTYYSFDSPSSTFKGDRELSVNFFQTTIFGIAGLQLSSDSLLIITITEEWRVLIKKRRLQKD